MVKKNKYITCKECKNRNNVTEMITNEDFEVCEYDENSITIFCQQCGKTITLKV